LPVLVRPEGGPTVAITESDLYDYPGMSVRGDGGTGYLGVFPRVATEEKAIDDRTVEVVRRADYIARTAGARTYPWRVFVIARTDADLVRSELVYKLARPLELDDTSWIRPGKVAWDWYNANNLFGVDFRAGVNTDTYKYYIDFASKHGLEYVILDEGWYVLPDLLHIAPEMDVEEIVAYGKKRGVAILPWVTWKSLEDQLEPAMEQFSRWGVAGIKVDFMQRDDQWMVNYYWRIAREAAKHQLLVDFHGAHKPAGLSRAYPNVMSYEGVKGAEHNKWSSEITPEHNLTIPFIRMLAGPMDYTPGSMVNLAQDEHVAIFNRPMTQGTRCHQLAMYVVFESPLQMLCENPALYHREPACMRFLGPVPSVWDETRVLEARLGDYVVVARRRYDTWYIGAMTNWTPRKFDIPLDFLSFGNWSAEIWKDGINADRHAEDFATATATVTGAEHLTAHLAPGGGWVAVLRQK
jgi:alpha-glucosidase